MSSYGNRPPSSQERYQESPVPPGGGGGGPPNNRNNGNSSLGSITLKVIISRDEVQYLFGFDAVLINQLRQQTGANINLTEGDTHERVLFINGSLELIFKAFSLICRKLWDYITSVNGNNLVLRLAVPASQCGSIIGKQGAKVKEIRDLTGANIQVSQESLPESTERCVEISGSGEACLQCTYHICCVLQDAPIRGEIVPYVPQGGARNWQQQPEHDDWKPVFLCGDKAYIIDGNVARLAPPELLRKELGKTALGPMAENLAADMNNNNNNNVNQRNSELSNTSDPMDPLALMAAISNAQRNGTNVPQTSREININNDFVGTIIGKGGAKIAEIRRMSGAQVHINQDDDIGPDGARVITLTGSEESILLAQFLIQSTIDITIKERNNGPMHNNQENYNNQPPPNMPNMDGPPPQMMENKFHDDRGDGRRNNYRENNRGYRDRSKNDGVGNNRRGGGGRRSPNGGGRRRGGGGRR